MPPLPAAPGIALPPAPSSGVAGGGVEALPPAPLLGGALLGAALLGLPAFAPLLFVLPALASIGTPPGLLPITSGVCAPAPLLGGGAALAPVCPTPAPVFPGTGPTYSGTAPSSSDVEPGGALHATAKAMDETRTPSGERTRCSAMMAAILSG
jgi:hypothetical protein